ncbi:DUF1801 domain-containing protein [Flavobacterium agricola]|uniref:DUF1801 domain-containing protein n=1 Tax=Flavobacterium agricola TaxID=2870839 RepID=A0ABY6LVK8_9FLAO|nr:DUF1801 domain-containing protein [Flavobacterium agricola]UYW00364.1 DUF1801 domain-containing protein [Flavobacterium agricola]
MTAVQNISDYIAQLDAEHQAAAQNLHNFILAHAPAQTQATISYKIPTYKYNGNLLHFAFAKKHIGLYPGPEAIAHFTNQLHAYKQTKGAIQIPYNQPFPFSLLADILAYNIDLLADKKGPSWHNYRANWQEANEVMEQIVVQLPLQKTFKWGTDVYTFQDKNVVAWGGFKNFFAIWFYNGVFLTDPLQVLVNANEAQTKALRQWRFTSDQKLPEAAIKNYIQEAIETVKQGKVVAPAKTVAPTLTGYLAEQVNQNSELKKAFDALTPGKQNEYIAYIEEAKQEKTKASRYTKIVPLILAGQGLNDKYKK